MRTRAPTDRRWLIGAGFLVLAMAGTVIGHTAVWALVGGASPGLAAARSVHNYLRPVGAILVVLGACVSWIVWRMFAALGRTATRLRRSLRFPEAPAVHPANQDLVNPGPGPLWTALVAVQLCVYSVQENLEASAVHVRPPGLTVLTAHHGAPIAVHAAVALALAALATLVCARIAHRHRAVERIVRLLRALATRRGLVGAPAMSAAGGAASPLARFGPSFLPRPPPLAAG